MRLLRGGKTASFESINNEPVKECSTIYGFVAGLDGFALLNTKAQTKQSI
jgi:hypothetical protein